MMSAPVSDSSCWSGRIFGRRDWIFRDVSKSWLFCRLSLSLVSQHRPPLLPRRRDLLPRRVRRFGGVPPSGGEGEGGVAAPVNRVEADWSPLPSVMCRGGAVTSWGSGTLLVRNSPSGCRRDRRQGSGAGVAALHRARTTVSKTRDFRRSRCMLVQAD